MDEMIRNLMTLGLTEYEARVYAALVGIGEGSARQVHEASGVPRPRVYDIAEGLAGRGFITVRRGNPHIYIPAEPAVVIHHLKTAADAAATAAVQALDALSLDARSKNSPIWYVQGEWSIRRHVESLASGVTRDLAVVCLDYREIGEFARLIAGASREHPVSVLLPNGKRGIRKPLGDASLYVPKPFCTFFQENIFEKLYCGPIPVDGSAFLLEYIFIADDRVCMIVYREDGVRNAVVITLPFISCVQRQFVNRMIANADCIDGPAEAGAGLRPSST
ncbi:TrmB family transcriptional regulator [Methanoculleus sp. Wushi-C6]|uniref:TrmB family transcriptional regulator n=1 Tax=Methanoculleus caldifontis TaxID=2651577 RepID=A0ABU3X3G1_9EURY|nr:helix-turn-helix domain-containing protein [Methanoculleus sp. Wushi-C6]MDV2482476.1 TrmB family transcriptional regulator [Methanoculleus sp. Wushi-C6]